jgi:hypothetical protein
MFTTSDGFRAERGPTGRVILSRQSPDGDIMYCKALSPEEWYDLVSSVSAYGGTPEAWRIRNEVKEMHGNL